MDGVDTRDPEGGSAWTFFNQNLIEEIQIGGLGAPAEYGGFTGAIINTVTKSGGNAFSGLFSMRYTDKGLSSREHQPGDARAEPEAGLIRGPEESEGLHGADGRAARCTTRRSSSAACSAMRR